MLLKHFHSSKILIKFLGCFNETISQLLPVNQHFYLLSKIPYLTNGQNAYNWNNGKFLPSIWKLTLFLPFLVYWTMKIVHKFINWSSYAGYVVSQGFRCCTRKIIFYFIFGTNFNIISIRTAFILKILRYILL